MAFDLGDYKAVDERMVDLFDKHPDASLQPASLTDPFKVITIGDRVFIAYAAACFRSPDDPRPGIGVAWEPFPGKSNYTKDSELQNAETSAWGRAIVAVGASTTKGGIASRNEVSNRRADQGQAPKGGKACAVCGDTLTGKALPYGSGIAHEKCLTDA